MSNVMMALGMYRFSLSTAAYASLRATHEWRWTSQAREGRKPARQYMGPGATGLTLEGTIYPHHAGGLGQIDRMRAEADKGAPLLLVCGYGRQWGRFVIERIEESQSALMGHGAPLRIDFTVQLGEYGEDAAWPIG